MRRTPVEELQTATGIEKADDETVQEYVERVGTTEDADSEVIEGALAYVTEWLYSDAPPDDDSAYQALLRQVETADAAPEESATAGAEDAESHASASSGQTATSVGEQAEQDRSREDDEQVESDRPVGDSEHLKRELATEEGDHPGPDLPDEERPGVKSEPTSTTGAADALDSRTELLPGRTDSGDDATGFKSGLRGKEPRKLLVRFVAIVAIAPVVGAMIARAWVPGNALYDSGRALLSEVLGLSGPAAVDLVALFAGGLYVSLLAIFTLDVKKRVQGMLLLLGTAVSMVTVWWAGVFFPALELTTINGLSFALGIAAGLAIEAGQLRALDRERSTLRRPTLSTGAVPEFRYAAMVLFGVLSVVVSVTLVQVVLADAVGLLDVLAAGAFLVVLYQFVQYESETQYVTLGPERSGKSMLLLGLCLELMRNAETYPNPNDYLQQGFERASNLQAGAAEWPIPSTAHDEVRAASFEVISGSYFPRRIELTALDYAGQHLGRVADHFAGGETAAEESVPGQVAGWVGSADTLIVLLDVERLVFPEAFNEAGVTDAERVSWGLEYYGTILDAVDPDDVLVVATKCDILADQGLVDPPAAHDSYAEFSEAVTDHLTARPDVSELLQTADESSVQPVYFVTERRDGEYVPRLDDDGNLVPVGYDALVDEIRRRQ